MSPSLSRWDLETLRGREGPRSYRVKAHTCPHVAGLTSVSLHTHTLPGLPGDLLGDAHVEPGTLAADRTAVLITNSPRDLLVPRSTQSNSHTRGW